MGETTESVPADLAATLSQIADGFALGRGVTFLAAIKQWQDLLLEGDGPRRILDAFAALHAEMAKVAAREAADKRPRCAACGRRISRGLLAYQGPLGPIHKGCRIVIKRSADGGI